jgi:hypothetical protein
MINKKYGFSCDLEKIDEDENLHCYNCKDLLILTSKIKLNNQVNFKCKNENCKNFGFIIKGIMFQSKKID